MLAKVQAGEAKALSQAEKDANKAKAEANRRAPAPDRSASSMEI